MSWLKMGNQGYWILNNPTSSLKSFQDLDSFGVNYTRDVDKCYKHSFQTKTLNVTHYNTKL